MVYWLSPAIAAFGRRLEKSVWKKNKANFTQMPILYKDRANKKVSYCLDSLITHSFVWRIVCCTINQHSRLRHFCKWLLTQDVPSQDYPKESIRTEPLMCCSLLARVRTHANQLKLFLLMAGILCAVPQKLIWCCQAKAHWLSGVSERTVSEPHPRRWVVFWVIMPFLFGRGTHAVLLVDEISPCLAFKGFGLISFPHWKTFWSSD